MKKSTCTKIMLIVLLCLSMSACKTVPTEVPNTISEPELLQLAQTAIDEDNFEAARFYFEKMIAMYGMNMSSLVVAEFELAHLDIKEQKFKEAQPILEKVVSYYDDPSLASILPPAYKKLALIDLEKCLQKEEQ